jgi:hypothetical protein
MESVSIKKYIEKLEDIQQRARRLVQRLRLQGKGKELEVIDYAA